MCEGKTPWRPQEKDLWIEVDCLYYGDYTGNCLKWGGPRHGQRCSEAKAEKKLQPEE